MTSGPLLAVRYRRACVAGSSLRLSNTMVSGRNRRSTVTSRRENAARSSSPGVHTVPPARVHTPPLSSAETTSASTVTLDWVVFRLAGSVPRSDSSVSCWSNSSTPSLAFAVLPWMTNCVTGSGMVSVCSSSMMISAASKPSSVSPVQSVTVNRPTVSTPSVTGTPNGM